MKLYEHNTRVEANPSYTTITSSDVTNTVDQRNW